MPDRCICAEPGVGCWIVRDHWRARKTGPRFPLAVVRCVVHEVAFTLYPSGHVPYGTAAVASVGPAGEPLGDRADTMFEAAADAADGRAWARETPRDGQDRLQKPPDGWWSTQLRRIDRAAHVVGVADGVGDRTRERIVEALGIDLLDVAEARSKGNGGYTGRGRAVCRVLDLVPVPPLERILVAGHLADCWGPPRWWDEAAATLVDLVGRRAPPPPTNPPAAGPGDSTHDFRTFYPGRSCWHGAHQGGRPWRSGSRRRKRRCFGTWWCRRSSCGPARA